MKISYPKLLILIFCIMMAYLLFRSGAFSDLENYLNHKGYYSALLGGFLFAYGFTAPFAVGILVALAPNVNIYLGAMIAGMGAFLGDYLIFRFVRTTFKNEFDQLKFSAVWTFFRNFFENRLNEKVKKYLLWAFAGILIASPLPDEFGVSLLSGFTNINQKWFSIISYTLNTLGIFVILSMAA